jgi:hypothetical protein
MEVVREDTRFFGRQMVASLDILVGFPSQRNQGMSSILPQYLAHLCMFNIMMTVVR